MLVVTPPALTRRPQEISQIKASQRKSCNNGLNFFFLFDRGFTVRHSTSRETPLAERTVIAVPRNEVKTVPSGKEREEKMMVVSVVIICGATG